MKKVIVHNGVFHADDCMVVAMMKWLYPEIVVERKGINQITDEDKNDPDILIADIGYGEFDHHQKDAKLRSDGNKHAACGLVFEKFKNELFPDESSARLFRNSFIIPIEDADNGISHNSITSAIIAFRPNILNNSPTAMESRFDEAVDFLYDILMRAINNAKADVIAKEMVTGFEKDFPDGILIREDYFPVELLCDSSIVLEISKNLRGGYQIVTVKVNNNSFEDKISLPLAWLEIKPDGCNFVHQNRFIASFDTKDQAISAAKKVIAFSKLEMPKPDVAGLPY